MTHPCPACGHANATAQRFCGQCGGPLDRSSTETRTSAPPAGPPAPATRQQTPAERFLPGAVLAGRYRMVGLLGRGGMGEVYRADDLKLGQPVALKFLPREVERDADRLERFLTEVRLSLRVTHPNVCRVFDIGEMEGRHFLSMEYVDGEDLASLLRRIGRLPEDKAIEIARQLCAGLAAAHEEGVLHRDLKPANVMLDGRAAPVACRLPGAASPGSCLGLLALVTTIVFSSWTPLSLTTDPSSWFFPTSVVTMLLFGGLPVYAFVVSLGGQRVFKESVLE